MKKLLCMLLCLLLLPGGAMGLGEAASTGRAQAFAVSGDSVWRADSAALTCETLEGGRAASVPAEGIVAMAAQNGSVWCLRGAPGAQSVEQYDGSCALLTAIPLPEDFSGWQIAVSGATLYLLGQRTATPGDWSDLKANCIYQMAAEAGSVPEPVSADGWANENVDSFCAASGTLYVHSNFELYAVNASNGKRLTQPIESHAYRCPLAPGPDLDGAHSVFLIDSTGAQVSLLHLKTGEATALSDMAVQEAVGLVADGGMIYAMERSDGALRSALAARPDDADYSGQLCIVNLFDSPNIDHAISLFRERYPDVQVTHRTETDLRVLSAALMSGASGYDVVFTGGGPSEFLSPLSWASGAMLDLAQYPEVAQHLSAYQLNFDSWRVGDALYGVPLYVAPDFWRFDEEIAAAAGVERPERGWTWADMAQMADQLEACNQANGTDYKLLTDSPILPFFLRQYTTNALDVANLSIDYLSEDLSAVLAQYRDWHGRGLIAVYEDAAPSLFTVSSSTSFQMMSDAAYLIPPAVSEGDRPISSGAPSIHVNANTADPEMAAYFVACVLNPESEQCNELLLNGPNLKDPSGYATGGIAAYVPMPSEENIALWNEMAETSLTDVFINDLFREQADILLPRYLAGEMSAEEFLKTCQRRSDMVLGE